MTAKDFFRFLTHTPSDLNTIRAKNQGFSTLSFKWFTSTCNYSTFLLSFPPSASWAAGLRLSTDDPCTVLSAHHPPPTPTPTPNPTTIAIVSHHYWFVGTCKELKLSSKHCIFPILWTNKGTETKDKEQKNKDAQQESTNESKRIPRYGCYWGMGLI